MPLQNRVTPWGEIVATPARGALMGNRGILHDHSRVLGVSRWKHKVWVTCQLDFRGRHRAPMPAGRYTALFFLDEVTALAAGHRPCGECRRDALNRYRAALGKDETASLPLAEIDRCLHGERTDRRTRQSRPHDTDIGSLPDGAMILTPDGPSRCALIDGDALYPWTETGYGAPLSRPLRGAVAVLTPPTSVQALANGYRAMRLAARLHGSLTEQVV